jgi:hypothetical protein
MFELDNSIFLYPHSASQNNPIMGSAPYWACMTIWKSAKDNTDSSSSLRIYWRADRVWSWGLDLALADVRELPVAETLLGGAVGWVLGNRDYWSPKLIERLQNQRLHLLAFYKSSKRETKPRPLWLIQRQRRIAHPGGLFMETVIERLVDRLYAQRVWARDVWYFLSCWLREVLSHMLAILFCQQQWISPSRFSELQTI